jgi:tetratricopeptide (TPR) repeat protein
VRISSPREVSFAVWITLFRDTLDRRRSCAEICRLAMRGTDDAPTDGVRSARQLAVAAPLLAVLTGCSTFLARAPEEPTASATTESLTAVVAELKLHMRDDTYRFDRAVTEDGRNVYAVALWKLDRIAALRSRPADGWENADYVIEFARGKALERQRRYGDALAAYRRVEDSGSLLGDAARERAAVMERFAAAATAPEPRFATPEEELRFLDERLELWRRIGLDLYGQPQESLAREEAEAWEILRVDWYERSGDLELALAACRSLIERNRESKLYASHLLRLGDLYADAARREKLQARARLSDFDAERYDVLLDQAFAAYELAGEDHKSALRREARTRIAALLAYHEGVQGHAP